MRYTAAIAAAFVAGAVASYQPTDYSTEGHDVAEPMHDDYDCDGKKCDDMDDHDDHDDMDDHDDYDCHDDDDSYDCEMSSSSYYSSSSDYHYSTSDYHYESTSVVVHPVPTSTYYGTTYTTDVVEHYETYCPEPTEVVYNEKTYTVTEATTLTIVDCPCTVTRPVVTSVITDCPEHECPTEKPTPVDTILATDTVVVVPVDTHAPVVPVEPVAPIDTHVPGPVDTAVPVVPVSPKEPVVEPVVPVVDDKPVVPVVDGEPVVPVVDGEPVVPVVDGEPVAPFPVNSTVPVTPVGTGVASPSATLFEGAGSKVTFSGAGLAAIFAAVVYAL